MQERKLTKTLILAIISIIVVLMLLGTATFAWFSSNQRVASNTVSARVGESDVQLLLGSSESDLSAEGDIAINQVNDYDVENNKLTPVSTADLENWVYCPSTDNAAGSSSDGDGVQASTFVKFDDEKYIYHGEIYMRADAPQFDDESKMDIYFDLSEDGGGALGSTEGEEGFLNAARLGLVFEDADNQEQKIFFFEENNVGTANVNTYVGGSKISDNQVLDSSSGSVSPVEDPAVKYDDYALQLDSGSTEIPEKPIATIDLNKTYKVDVYYYLEGCDPDCVDEIRLREARLHLAFYGLIE